MRTTAVLVVMMLAICAFQCENNSFPDESEFCTNTAWLKTIIETTKQNSSKAEVIRYRYKEQTVYYIDTCIDCPDSMAQVYTCSGEVICQFGGFAGFNTCPDFNDTATDKKVIWKN